ncbi:hypothetical protein MLD38_021701 [Melastoma candidum]|uniref:Uncharacterized protein n=1 Tax=Melastoma candidum TaxID=119954 RepID=A0ACB9QI39_9MYRT|nr:hypothetical protein MLD38_021701 [Melastoma candidum]
MERYQRVEKAKEDVPINENEIRITSQGLVRNYISYSSSLLQERHVPEIVLKAMGQAISKTVAIAEIIKKRMPRLYQDTAISSVSITDVWEPIEEGLVPVEMTRHVSMISITLSFRGLNKKSPGYQAPLHGDQAKPQYRYQQQPRQARALYYPANEGVEGEGEGEVEAGAGEDMETIKTGTIKGEAIRVEIMVVVEIIKWEVIRVEIMVAVEIIKAKGIIKAKEIIKAEEIIEAEEITRVVEIFEGLEIIGVEGITEAEGIIRGEETITVKETMKAEGIMKTRAIIKVDTIKIMVGIQIMGGVVDGAEAGTIMEWGTRGEGVEEAEDTAKVGGGWAVAQGVAPTTTTTKHE